MQIDELQANAKKLRKRILEVCYKSKAGHIGGSLSSIDILNVLYNNVMNVNPSNFYSNERDRFILSKGHVAESLYVTLANKGFYDDKNLDDFSTYNSHFIGHPNKEVKGIEMNTGSLGHGLSLAVGCAIGAKLKKMDFRVYVLMGDGEQAEGSLWEAAMAASHYNLDNLCAVLDRNMLQISGNTEDVMSLKDLKGKWEKFGFNVIEVNGNDYNQLLASFQQAKDFKGKPSLILAKTTKGKGVSFMENNISWHHGVMNEEQFKTAIKDVEET